MATYGPGIDQSQHAKFIQPYNITYYWSRYTLSCLKQCNIKGQTDSFVKEAEI